MMKTLILAFSLLMAHSAMSFAQCGKKVKLTGSKTTYLNGNGIEQRSVDEKSVILVNPSEVIINVDNQQKMACTIKSATCKWTVPFKEGKTVIKAVAGKGQGESKNVTLTIQGKKGKVTFLFEMEDRPDNIISVAVNNFAEED